MNRGERDLLEQIKEASKSVAQNLADKTLDGWAKLKELGEKVSSSDQIFRANNERFIRDKYAEIASKMQDALAKSEEQIRAAIRSFVHKMKRPAASSA